MAGFATGGAAGDGDNLRAFLDFQAGLNFESGTATGLGTLSNLLSDVGNTVSAAETDSSNRVAVLADLDSARTALSGVDTDEEAIHLIEYQSAYRAAAQVISAADELLRTLLAIGS